MPIYVDDLDNPGKKVDVIELQLRDPNRELPPIFIQGWLKRDLWKRREAMLLLAGFDPDATTWGETNGSFNAIPSGRIGYLDGTTAHQLSPTQHPRQSEALSDFWKLSAWSEHSSLDQACAPQEWIDWATKKGFTPYWKSFAQNAQNDYIPLANASRSLAEMQAGDLSCDEGIVWAHEITWQSVIDHLLKQDALAMKEKVLPLLARCQDGEKVRFESTTELQGAWVATENLWRIYKNPPCEVIEKLDNKRQYAEEEARQREAARHVAGRYTLGEAAEILDKQGGERKTSMCRKLCKAAFDGDLPVYEPGRNARYEYGQGKDSNVVREFYEEVRWDELNQWLEKNESHITIRFPSPSLGTVQSVESVPAPTTGAEKEAKTGAQEIAHHAGDVTLIIGRNNREALKPYIEKRARELYREDSTKTKRQLGKDIAKELRDRGHQGLRTTDEKEETAYLSGSAVERLLPRGLTGGRQANGRKSNKK